MKKFKRLAVIIIGIELLLILIANLYVLGFRKDDSDRLYRVEAKRITDEIKNGKSIDEIDLSKYSTIVNVRIYDPSVIVKEDYIIEQIDGEYFQFCYIKEENISHDLQVINIVCGAMFIITVFVFIYLFRIVISPFDRIKELPYELSKGNLVVPVKEEKNKVFGRFLWGMDLLRGNLEDAKEEELRLQREKKTLLLSISHDIRTPLSSIKLYSKALSENLYTDEEKIKDAYSGIQKNAAEIEKYVNEIVAASKEDFLHLQVENSPNYLGEIISEIESYYVDKLEPLNTKFTIQPFDECMINCDKARLIEVLQNIMENAIKYGDGLSIDISVTEEEDCKIITIINSGTPISENEIPHLFESFYRGSNAKTKKGSGLGLYICKTLLRMMDGDIYMSQIPDGNQFSVVIHKA